MIPLVLNNIKGIIVNIICWKRLPNRHCNSKQSLKNNKTSQANTAYMSL